MDKIVLRLLVLSKEDCLTLYLWNKTGIRPRTVVRLRILKVVETPWSMIYSWMLKVNVFSVVSISCTDPFNDQIKHVNLTVTLNHRLVSLVGRVLVCRVVSHGFKLWLDQHSGSLNNWDESATFVMTSANGFFFLGLLDKDEKQYVPSQSALLIQFFF